jgi:uncharacterized membrane protein YidH (DUF202 family)
MDDIPKSVAWILGGSSLPTAVLALVGFAPRLIAAHPLAMEISILLIIFGLFCASIAGVSYLAKDQTRESRFRRRIPIIGISLGMGSTIVATAVLALSYTGTLNIKDLPRLALTVSTANAEFATVKLKVDADAQQPGGFFVVDVIAVPQSAKLPVGKDQLVPGHRVYHASIGSDSNGQISSEIETQLRRSQYRLVVAQTYPGPLNVDNSAPNNAEASTSLCADVELRIPRSCVYADIPS